MEDREELKRKLEALRSEHRDLDDIIQQISAGNSFDQLQVKRLKKRKLLLKDQIARLQSKLLPDIIA
ncbi:MAG: YdcH family protein [Kiloniellales bacterium]